MSKFARGFLYGAMGLVYALAIWLGYWLIRPYNIITDSPPVRRVLTPVVVRGQAMTYAGRGCKHGDYLADVSRELIDGLLLILPPVRTNYAAGCRGDVPVNVEIPANVPPGRYSMRLHIEFHPNPIRWVSYTFTTDEFLVVDEDTPAAVLRAMQADRKH